MAETFRVLLSDSLAAQGIEVLKRFPQLQFDIKTGLKPAELAKIIAPYDALLIRSGTRVTREVIDAATSLKVIGRAGVGVDNVDIEAATRRGIVVMNSPTGNSVTTAEHAITMMMALARHIPAANASIRARANGSAANSPAPRYATRRWAWSASAISAGSSPTARLGSR